MKQRRPILIGVGGAGCELAAECSRRMQLDSLYVNSDARHIERWPSAQRLLLSPSGSSSTLASPARIQAGAQTSERLLVERVEPYAGVVLLAGLGGQTGTHALAALARAVAGAGKPVLLAVTTPFDFETQRTDVAAQALATLKREGLECRVHDHSIAQRGRADEPMDAMLALAASALAQDIEAWACVN